MRTGTDSGIGNATEEQAMNSSGSEFIPGANRGAPGSNTRRGFLGMAAGASMAALGTLDGNPLAPQSVLADSDSSRSSPASVGTTTAVPFTIEVPEATLAAIKRRIRATTWPKAPTGGGWEYGVDLAFLRSLADYGLTAYDWRAQERTMNHFQHFKATIAGEDLHFVHELGSGASPQPLLLLHGWPYSFASFLPLVERLAHPERFGGDAADGFDVVIPSLPGYGFSDAPTSPLGPRAIAARMNELMTTVLGYDRYSAQGGDWGAVIASWLAFDHAAHCTAIHLNAVGMGPAGPAFWVVDPGPGPLSPNDRAGLGQAQTQVLKNMAYFFQQATRPLTTSYAMNDSPIGAAAWILDKFYLWSDRRERTFEEIYGQDRLLTEVMVYLVTGTFDTSIWIHNGFIAEESWGLPPGERIETPTYFAAYPDPLSPPPPRIALERVYNIVQWVDMPQGGHLPMLEQPELFVRDLLKFGRLVR